MLWVDIAIMKPMMPKRRGTMMCVERSWRVSEDRATTKAMTVAKAKGGAQRRSVMVRSYPRDPVSVGKNWLKEKRSSSGW